MGALVTSLLLIISWTIQENKLLPKLATLFSHPRRNFVENVVIYCLCLVSYQDIKYFVFMCHSIILSKFYSSPIKKSHVENTQNWRICKIENQSHCIKPKLVFVPHRKFKVNYRPHNSIFLQPKNQSCVHLVCSRPTSHALQILRALLLMAPKDIRLRKDSVSVS